MRSNNESVADAKLSFPKRKSEAAKRKEMKEILVITDENETPVTHGSKITSYLTRGLAEAAVRNLQKDFPDKVLQVTTYVPQSSRLIFMEGDEEL